jgi:hypothetical protein
MLFSRIKKPGAGADNVFQAVLNKNTSAALTNGQVVTWTTASTTPAVTTAPAGQAASYYVGTEVIVNPVTTPLPPAGIWAETSTPAGSIGLMQIYGMHFGVTAVTGVIHAAAICDTATAGRIATGGADPYATGTAGVIGEIVVAVAANVAGVHIKLM